MRSIERKLFRDLWALRGQALAIGLVIASGVATFTMSLSCLESLQGTRNRFYRDYRFGSVFASLKRAPEHLKGRIEAIPGVSRVATRVVAAVNLQIDDFPDPVTGQLFSIPDHGEALLNKLFLRKGRLIEAGRENEVVVSEAFANAHGFTPGDSIVAVINGKRKRFTIVGLALSPEHIYQIRPGALFPDFERYAILWMGRTPLSTAYDLESAFNDVVLSLSADAQSGDVIDRLDALLEPYGGLGAYGRHDQLSHRYLHEEFRQLENMARIFPTVFLSVAAFLLHVVLGRLVNNQREQIAALKAFGYSNFQIGLHYVKFVVVIAVVGTLGGLVGGIYLGRGMSAIYAALYKFPFLDYVLSPHVAATGAVVTTLAALFGTLSAVRRAALLPPAEAMRPEAPATYRETLVERLGLKRFLSQPTRMVIRHIERRPVHSFFSVLGISFACAILMVGSFQTDAIHHMVDVQFGMAQREDIAVTFVEPTSRRALHELSSLRGVDYVEPFRSVPARLRFEGRSYRTAIQGIIAGGDIHRLLDSNLEVVETPPAGVVLGAHLGKILGVGVGDRLTAQVFEGNRPERQIVVAGLIQEFIGVSAYMEISALNRLMREDSAISGAYVAVDSQHRHEIYSSLKEMPRVAGTEVRDNSIRNFYETMGDTLLIFTTINTFLAGTIAFGVVYNSARIALSERARELASLRVLGFTRGEISYILLGELAVLTLAGIPLGFLVGTGLCMYLVANLQTDLYRVPLVLEPGTFAFAATVILVAAAFSGAVVRQKLDHLDLVVALKTKE